jgi:capsular polysaccharide biosynthesis protein
LTAGDVYRALWRHKFFIAVLTAAFVGAAWYATSRETRKYEASTLVRLQERGDTGNAALLAAQTLTQTYAQIVDSGALKGEIRILVAQCSRQRAASKEALPQTPIPGPSSGSRRVVSGPPAGSCESLGVTHKSRAAPDMVSQVPLSGSPVQDLDLLSIGARSRNRRNATIAANAAPWALRAFIRKTRSSSEKVVTVKAATTPSSPISRQLPLKIAIAVMLGLIFNGALALLLEFFRDRLPEPDQLGQEVGVPVLATIPGLRLHEAANLEAARREQDSVSMARSRDGERSNETTGPRVGPEP